MALSEDEAEHFERILNRAEEYQNKLNPWERNFLADQRARFEEHGSDIRVSTKQWTVLNKIDNKLDE